MPHHADIAIIGGGVIGWSAAHHMKLLVPAADVLVIEQARTSAAGSTGKAAGGVRAQFGTEINIRLSLHSIREFERFPTDVSFRQRGYLFVTATKAGAEYLRNASELQKRCGVPVRVLARFEVAEFAPYINSEDVLLGSFSPTDGYLDPYSVCAGYESAARRAGARTAFGSQIADADQIEAGTIVLATGHWSGEAGSVFGLDLPVSPEKHQLAMTSKAAGFPEDLPMVVDLDTSFHFRREGEGLLIGFNHTNPKPEATEAEPTFDFGFLEALAPVALHRAPLLADAGFDSKRGWAGWYAETPDRHAIIDRVGDVVVATGFGGHGIMHAPAAGLAAAELALHGECRTFDLHPLRLSRFAENDLTLEPMVI